MITVIDRIMGYGKTTQIIEEMSKGDELYIYVTPFLEETERIQKALPYVITPNNKNERGSKYYHLIDLLMNDESISTTHKLFSNFLL